MTKPPDGYLGAEGLLASGPSPRLVEAGYALELADAAFLHQGLSLADLAHVMELDAIGVLPAGTAGRLCRELLAFWSTPVDEFPYDSLFGDAYNSRERELEKRLGAVAGWLPTGRTRREAGRIALRIALRKRLLHLHEAVADLATVLVAKGEGLAEAVYNDTTYLQPAQPSTFGYYLCGFAEQATRDLERIKLCHRWVNRSPAGSGGVGGTTIPLDRDRLASRLGFDEPLGHIRDGMWSADVMVDAALASWQAVLTLDRLAEDLEIFASPQFGYIRLAGSSSRASVLLPQKRNPYALSVIRGGAGTLIGKVTGLMATQRTPSARTDNWLYAYGEVISAVEMASRLVRLGGQVVRDMEVDVETLADSAGENYSVAADWAERLVLGLGFDYRSAYRVVARAVAGVDAAGGRCPTGEDLRRAAQEVGANSDADFEAVLAGIEGMSALVALRDAPGSSAPSRVMEHCRSVEEKVAGARRWSADVSARIDAAEARLLATASGIAGEE
ncbi:MAG: lyase family protein [bacterium]|nr:argininosuccinate lyase [Acidimicrobiia bacterium]MCY4649906.1 lyase family protein [bacterium]